MTALPLIEIPASLLNKHYAFLIPSPEYFAISNGITVLLDAALSLQSLGLKVSIVPSQATIPSYTHLRKPYADLPIHWDIPSGCSAILSDTVCKERLQEVRARAAQICHYTMAPSGLFGSEGMWSNRIWLKPGEKQAVYSPQISTQFPAFYLQTHFADLEPWIEVARQQPRRRRSHQLQASLYPGKGHLKPVPHELCTRIRRSRSNLITRFRPATKPELYQQMASSDLLICYDPITSLAHEASLLGIPVFIPVSWDEANFKTSFPVRLDGIVWNDVPAFLDILEYGFDHQAVLDSYRIALANNTQTLVHLLHFAFGDGAPPPAAEQINAYWDARQSFFTSLQLPSTATEWSLKEALPTSTPSDFLHDLLEFCREHLLSLYHRLSRCCRSIARRLRFLRRLYPR
jgi:hypothetical protein